MDTVTITVRPGLDILGILNLVGAAQGLLLTLALLSAKTDDKAPNRLLAALTLAISIVVSGSVLFTSNYFFLYPHLSRIHHPFVFLAGPLLFLYLRELTSNGKHFERKDFLHFIPSALCLIYLLPYYLQNSTAKLTVVSLEFLSESEQWFYIRSTLFFVQFLVYLVLVVLTVIQYSRRIKRRELPRDEAVVSELRFFVIGASILWVGAVLRYAINPAWMTNLVIPLGASILIYGLGYLKMRRHKPLPTKPAGELTGQPSVKKYEKSTLTPDRGERYLNKLLQCMKEEKPFTDGDLSLQKLAGMLSITPHHLSQIVNERLGQTFSDFINSYRIEEAKQRLLDPRFKHLSLLGIAVEVGFNSKSSFNSVFKKHTNMTPSEFRDSLNGSDGDR